jgi:hypothetical protein
MELNGIKPEFLWQLCRVSLQLANLPDTCLTARLPCNDRSSLADARQCPVSTSQYRRCLECWVPLAFQPTYMAILLKNYIRGIPSTKHPIRCNPLQRSPGTKIPGCGALRCANDALVHHTVSFATSKMLGMLGYTGVPPNLRCHTFELLH